MYFDFRKYDRFYIRGVIMSKLYENQSYYEDEEDNITLFIESNLGVYFTTK